jgi:hypothetical protein
MKLTKENLLTYISKAPEPEIKRLCIFLAQSLNMQNLKDLSPYFKVRMTFDPTQTEKKDVTQVFKEAINDKQEVKADPMLSKEDIEKLKEEKLLRMGE